MEDPIIKGFFIIFVAVVAFLAFLTFRRAKSFGASDYPEDRVVACIGNVELLEVWGPAGRRAAFEYSGDGVAVRVTFDRNQAAALARLLRSAAKV